MASIEMTGHRFWSTVFLLFLLSGFAECYSVERYEIVIYKKVETHNSSLSCLVCFNGDSTNDCMALKNISHIPTRTCTQHNPYCKVRRLTKDGNLITFDRYCASYCEPGCKEGARYLECVSCCNHKSYCNVDNAAQFGQRKKRLQDVFMLSILLYFLGWS